MKKHIKVVLVDDHQLVLQGLVSCLEKDEEIEIVGIYNSALEALESIPMVNPDVVVSDVRMAEMNGLELAKEIIEKFKGEIQVVLVSGFYNEEYHLLALDIGVSAFLAKDSSFDQFIDVIKHSYMGNAVVPVKLIHKQKVSKLTKIEIEIVNLIAQSKTNNEISVLLNMSRRTVEHHISSIFSKLGVDGRVGVVVKGIQLGIIKDII